MFGTYDMCKRMVLLKLNCYLLLALYPLLVSLLSFPLHVVMLLPTVIQQSLELHLVSDIFFFCLMSNLHFASIVYGSLA